MSRPDLEWPHPHPRVFRHQRDRVVQVAGFQQQNAAERFFGLHIRTIGDFDRVRAGESTRSSMGRQYLAFQVRGAIQVRIKNAPAFALSMMLIGTSASIAQSAPADDSPLQGNWKLVIANGDSRSSR
jgi:hypothetical protein